MKPSVPGRLHALGLDVPRFTAPAEVVRHLGCVQSQLPDMALWSLGRRLDGVTKTQLEESFDAGDFLRTHVLRPTWHFVDRSDIHWLLAVTAPRIRRLMAATTTPLGLTEQRLDDAAATITALLADGRPRTREEIADVLSAAGAEHRGQALAYVVMHAEINALIVNGPLRGKQHTYTLLGPGSSPTTRDDLLATLARRYGAGHGPFRDRDLAWWASLTLGEARTAIGLAGLRPVSVCGEDHWVVDEPVDSPTPRAMLLSNFDEYVSFARDPHDYEHFHGTAQDLVRRSGLLMLDGRVAGAWTRTIRAATVDIVVHPSRTVDRATRLAIEAEGEAYGGFVERRPTVDITA